MAFLAPMSSFASMSGAADTIRLIVSVRQNEVVAGYPIIISTSLTAKEPLEDIPLISPSAGNVNVYVESAENAARKRYLGPRWGIDERPPAVGMVTDDAPLKSAIPLLFHNVIEGRTDLASVPLPLVPGGYQVTVEYLGLGHERLVSGSVHVTVREPQTIGEKAYWAAMQADPALAESLQTGNFSRHPTGVAKAEELLREHPEAPHSSLAALAVGAHYLHVVKDAPKAERTLAGAVSRAVDPLLRSRIQYELASAMIVLGKFDAAATTIDSALTIADDASLSMDLRHLRAMLP
ncbi:MAG: hypothetical protein ACXW5U_25590 [Thermoanaerobaculia bacterium]